MIMSDLSKLVRHMRVFAERSMADEGLGFPDQLVLMLLADGKPTNQEQIARALDADKGAIAKTIGKLEDKGLVVRSENKRNRREKSVAATPLAAEAYECMKRGLALWNDRLYEGVSEDERQIFEAVLARMANNSNELIREGR